MTVYAIFDFDGVLVDNTARLHHLIDAAPGKPAIQKPDADWAAYRKEQGRDLAGPAVPLLRTLVGSGVIPFIVTARTMEDALPAITEFALQGLLPRIQGCRQVWTKEDDRIAADYKVWAIGNILKAMEWRRCVGYFEDSWQIIKAVKAEFPDLPIFRPHNLVRNEDVAGY